MLTISGLALASLISSANPKMETVYLPISSNSEQRVALHCVSPSHSTTRAVLFVHGSSFPTMLAFGFEFAPGDSWMTYMAARGYLACGLDFLGFGASSTPAAFSAPPDNGSPVMKAPAAAEQIALAATYLHHQRNIRALHIIAHSWGTIPAAMYAAQSPQGLASLTLFGPIVPVEHAATEKTNYAWWKLNARDRYEDLKFADVLPKGMYLLEPAVHARWAEEFASSAQPEAKTPDGDLRIPAGPVEDLDAAHEGVYPYALGKVTCPLFAVYGDYDTEVNDAGAAAFLAKFTASTLKWRLRIDHGTHVMHLEKNRHSLYASVYAFIGMVDSLK